MKIAFQADADFSQIIVNGVVRREPLIDFYSAHIASLRGLSDLAVLKVAGQAGRILVTHDRKTMPTAFAEFIVADQCAGVIIVPQSLPISMAIDDLVLAWLVSDSNEWINRIAFIPF